MTHSTYESSESFAARIDVEPDLVRRWINEGRLPAVKLGRVIFIPVDALERTLLARAAADDGAQDARP